MCHGVALASNSAEEESQERGREVNKWAPVPAPTAAGHWKNEEALDLAVSDLDMGVSEPCWGHRGSTVLSKGPGVVISVLCVITEQSPVTGVTLPVPDPRSMGENTSMCIWGGGWRIDCSTKHRHSWSPPRTQASARDQVSCQHLRLLGAVFGWAQSAQGHLFSERFPLATAPSKQLGEVLRPRSYKRDFLVLTSENQGKGGLGAEEPGPLALDMCPRGTLTLCLLPRAKQGFFSICERQFLEVAERNGIFMCLESSKKRLLPRGQDSTQLLSTSDPDALGPWI